MLWRLSLMIVAAVSLSAALLPEEFAGYRRGPAALVNPDSKEIWGEYGLEGAERAEYTGPAGTFVLTAYRLQDPTGAFAAFQWQRPANAQSGDTSARTPSGALIQHQNYLLSFEQGRVHPSALEQLYSKLPDVVSTSLPPLYGYLPKKGKVANSERYLIGDEALGRFVPEITPELAAFNRGAEAQSARYRIGGEEVQLTVLSYPTPQMAMERMRVFTRLAGAAVKRTGPMIAVVPGGQGKPAVERLLAGINYSPNLMWNEYAPKDTPQDAAKMVLAIIALAGILIAAAAAFGFFVGGSRIVLRRLGIKQDTEEFTALNLSGK